jgi:K+-transporting ATPase KdpF subunit
MGLVSELAQHLGLVTLTAIAAVLTIYLLYAMVRPEKF